VAKGDDKIAFMKLTISGLYAVATYVRGTRFRILGFLHTRTAGSSGKTAGILAVLSFA
jgi:hypothetical protein